MAIFIHRITDSYHFRRKRRIRKKQSFIWAHDISQETNFAVFIMSKQKLRVEDKHLCLYVCASVRPFDDFSIYTDNLLYTLLLTIFKGKLYRNTV